MSDVGGFNSHLANYPFSEHDFYVWVCLRISTSLSDTSTHTYTHSNNASGWLVHTTTLLYQQPISRQHQDNLISGQNCFWQQQNHYYIKKEEPSRQIQDSLGLHNVHLYHNRMTLSNRNSLKEITGRHKDKRIDTLPEPRLFHFIFRFIL